MIIVVDYDLHYFKLYSYFQIEFRWELLPIFLRLDCDEVISFLINYIHFFHDMELHQGRAL